MKQGVLILFMLTCFLMENRLFAQDFKNEEVRKLLISAGELEQEDKCSYYAYEIETSNMMTSLDTCGVYRIGAHVSESYEHILLLDKQKTIFIDCHKKDLAQALKLLFSFFDNCSHRFTDSEKLSYIEGVVSIYSENETAIPW